MSERPGTPFGRLVLDCAVIAGLTLVALSSLDQTFSDRGYLVTGAVALAISMTLTVYLAESGRNVVLLMVLAVAVFVLLGPFVALGAGQQSVLPSVQDFLDVLIGPFTAWNGLLSVIPPVDPSGRELMVPYALCFIAGTTATWLALRTRLVLLPAMPIVAVLVVSILLGVQQPDLLTLRAVVLTTGLVGWTGLRGRRLRDEGGRDGAGGVVTTTVVVGLVCAGVLAFLSPPTAAQDRVVLHGRVGQGADLSNLDNPLSSFRIFTEQDGSIVNNVYATRLLRVTGLPKGVPLRFLALDAYDGSMMRPDNRTVPDSVDDLFQRISHEVATGEKGTKARVGVQVLAGYRSSWIPIAGALTGLDFAGMDRSPQRDDVRYDPATRTLVALKGLRRGDDYTFASVLTPTEVTRKSEPYPVGGQLKDEAAFLDPWIAPWQSSAMTPMRKVFSLARYIKKNGRYSDGARPSEATLYPPGHGQSRLGAGFIGAQAIVGDDEQYAAFMALAASRLGVPARVVVGAYPNKQGYVSGRNVSVWVELRVADGSWRTLPTSTFMSHVAPKPSDPEKEPAGNYVTGDDQAPVLPPDDPQQVDDPAGPAGSHGGLPDPRWLLVLVAVLAVVPPVAKQVRRVRRRRASVASTAIAGGWDEVIDLAVDLGRPPSPGRTRIGQAEQLGSGVALAERADQVFGATAPDDAEARAFWDAVRVEEKELRRTTPLPRRIWAVWNPASLVSRLRGARRRWPSRG